MMIAPRQNFMGKGKKRSKCEIGRREKKAEEGRYANETQSQCECEQIGSNDWGYDTSCAIEYRDLADQSGA